MDRTSSSLRSEIKRMIDAGVTYNDIFKELYPSYRGHYATLRTLIHEVKVRG